MLLNLHQNNFCFQNARLRFQDLFWTNIPSPNWKWEKWENGRLKTIIWQSCWQSTHKGNDQYKGATLCLEGKIDLLEKRWTFPTTRQGGILVYKRQLDPFKQVTTNVFKSETAINEWSSQIIWRDEKSLVSKWVTMDTITAKLCKWIWEETYIDKLE